MSEAMGTTRVELPEEQKSGTRPGTARDLEAARPRWPLGSWARITHGAGLALALRASLIAAMVAGGALLGVSRDMKPIDGRVFLLLAIVSVIGIGGVVYAGLFRGGRVRSRDLGIHADHLWREIGLGVLGFVLVCAALVATVAVFHQTVPLADAGRTIAGYSMTQRLLFLGIGIEAAITEETIFRGYLQPALVARFGAALGIFLCAAFFALYHLNLRPSALAGKLAVGLVLGVLRGKDRSLVAPAVAHALIWAVLGTL